MRSCAIVLCFLLFCFCLGAIPGGTWALLLLLYSELLTGSYPIGDPIGYQGLNTGWQGKYPTLCAIAPPCYSFFLLSVTLLFHPFWSERQDFIFSLGLVILHHPSIPQLYPVLCAWPLGCIQIWAAGNSTDMNTSLLCSELVAQDTT